MTQKCFVYLRYSPHPKSSEVHSLEVQEDSVLDYCEKNDLEIADVYREPDTSARVALKNRPKGREMLKRIRREKIKHVVIQKLDRIFRDTRDGLEVLERWEKAGVRLHLADEGGVRLDTGTAVGYMVTCFLLSVASFEPRRLSERTRAGTCHRVKNLKRSHGTPPYGWMQDPDNPDRLIEHAEEQAAIRRIMDLKSLGKSLMEIRNTLKKEGYEPRGADWRVNTIRAIAKRHAEDGWWPLTR